MTIQKGVRLFKVLRELNVARDTLLDYLKEKGYGLEGSGPNARLSDEVYEKVLSAFADEKQAVERHVKRVRELRKEGMIEDGLTLEYMDGATDSTPATKPVVVEEPEPEPEPIVAEAEPEPEPEVEEPSEEPAVTACLDLQTAWLLMLATLTVSPNK